MRVIPRRRSYEPRRARALARSIREDGIQLLHSLSLHVNLYAYLATRLARGPDLVTSNRVVDPECGRVATWLHGAVFRRSRRVVVNSEAGREFTSRFFGVPRERIVVIPNGHDLRRFEHLPAPAITRAALALPANVPVAGLVGRIDTQKRVDLFLESARIVSIRIPAAHFLVVGDGPLLPEMKPLSERLAIGARVHFTGARDDVPALLSAMDLLVMTSEFEGLPNAVLEAMAAGRPVVSTDVGGCRELVVEGVTGHLVPPRDPEAIADRIVRILASPDRGRSLGAAGRHRALSEFSAPAMAKRFEDLYLRIHDEGREGRRGH